MMNISNYFKNFTNKHAILIIVLIACFHAINTLIVLKTNHFYSAPDESVTCIVDMSHSFCQEYQLIKLVDNSTISEFFKNLVSYMKPPVYFLTAFPFLYFIHDINIFITVFNLFISLITLLSVYGIVSKINSKQAGLFASLTLSLYPLFFSMHRTFFIETLLAATVALSLYIIILHKPENKFPALALTFVLTAGLLTKEQFFVYMPFLLLFIFYTNYKSIKNNVILFISFFLAFILAYIAWFCYLPVNIFVHLINYAKDNINMDYFFYFKDYFYFSLTPFVSIFWIIATGYFIFKKKNFLWILNPLLILFIFSVSGNKVIRHMFPVIIFIPVLITLFIYEIKNNSLRRFIIAFSIIFMFLQFLIINYSDNRYYRQSKFNVYNSFKALNYAFYIPKTETYKMQYSMIENIIGKSFAKKTAFVQVFTPFVYNLLIINQNRYSDICNIYTYESLEYIKNNINLYDNIIISDRDKNTFNEFDIWLTEKNTKFKKIQSLTIYNHDSAQIWLYQKSQ